VTAALIGVHLAPLVSVTCTTPSGTHTLSTESEAVVIERALNTRQIGTRWVALSDAHAPGRPRSRHPVPRGSRRCESFEVLRLARWIPRVSTDTGGGSVADSHCRIQEANTVSPGVPRIHMYG
jgi:hypothetical protein